MTVQITIIGLGQIGASFGLALAAKRDLIQRTGHDKEASVARQAEKLGAVDKVEVNLHRAVKDADLVLLCVPMDQLRETLELISGSLKTGAVIMETGPAKEMVSNWVKELMPGATNYVGLTPVINAAYLHGTESGLEAAHPDLFRGGLMAIVSPPQTDSTAIKLAADLTRLVGADPLFADPVEIDGLMAATHLLPQLMAAALLNATIDQPGWREGKKVAGRAYAEASGPIVHLSQPQALSASSLLNRDNILRMLDSASAALEAIRGDIERQDEAALNDRLSRARSGRLKWWGERRSGEWMDGTPVMELPETPGTLSRLFGVGRKPKTKDSKTEKPSA